MPVVLKLIDARGNPIKGESKVPGHENEIDIVAWSWGVIVPTGAKLNILDIHTTDNFFRCVSSRSEGISVMLKTCPDCNGDGVVDKDTDNERQWLTCGGRGV